MSTKTIKREKIYLNFNRELYNIVRNGASEKVRHLNNAIEELETIIKKPIDDYKTFSKDILGYSMKQIKETFPKPFDLASYYKYFVESSFDADGKVKLSVRVQFVLTGN